MIKKGAISLIVIVATVFVVAPFSFAYGNGWEWAETAFDVDNIYSDEVKGENDQKDIKKDDVQSIFENVNQRNPTFDSGGLRSASSANYTKNPTEIKWYRLSEQGFNRAYELVCGILNTSILDYSMFIMFNSNSNAYIYICQYGYLGMYQNWTSGSSSENLRFFYGPICQMPAPPSGDYDETDVALFAPEFYCYVYDFTSETFTDRNLTIQSNSTNGYLFNYSISVQPNGYYNYVIFSYPYANYVSYVRDYYFFGCCSYSEKVRLSPNFTTAYKPIDQLNSSSYPYHRFCIKAQKSNSLGSCVNRCPYSSYSSSFFCSTDYETSDFILEHVDDYQDDWSSDFSDSVDQFTSDTQNLITRLNSMKSRFTNYISTYFTIFTNTSIPSAIYFLILFLVVVALLVGIFT